MRSLIPMRVGKKLAILAGVILYANYELNPFQCWTVLSVLDHAFCLFSKFHLLLKLSIWTLPATKCDRLIFSPFEHFVMSFRTWVSRIWQQLRIKIDLKQSKNSLNWLHYCHKQRQIIGATKFYLFQSSTSKQHDS